MRPSSGSKYAVYICECVVFGRAAGWTQFGGEDELGVLSAGDRPASVRRRSWERPSYRLEG